MNGLLCIERVYSALSGFTVHSGGLQYTDRVYSALRGFTVYGSDLQCIDEGYLYIERDSLGSTNENNDYSFFGSILGRIIKPNLD